MDKPSPPDEAQQRYLEWRDLQDALQFGEQPLPYGWICPRCREIKAPWLPGCPCDRNVIRC